MAVSRLFIEISQSMDRLSESLRQSITAAESAGVKVTNAGKSMLASFDAALNPTKALGEQIKLLEMAGKNTSEIYAVMGERMKAASDVATKHRQAIDPIIKKHLEFGDSIKKSIFSLESLSSSMGTVQKAFIGMGLALGMREAISGIINISKASADMAMNAVESENLFAVSMGKMSEDALKWSKSLSESLGLNQYELRKNIGTFNVMLSSMGLTSDQAYKMSSALTKLAYDFASFYNLKPEEAFDKLRSGISGESEPLKRLGILVEETTTKSYAYAHGIATVGQELTQQQKVLARYGSIMEQTSAAQGDLARTIDSPANKLRLLKSRTDELQISLGLAMIPTISAVTGELTGFASATNAPLSGLQNLAKVIASPVMGFYVLGSAIADIRLKIAEFDLWMHKKLGQIDSPKFKESALELRDRAAAAAEWTDKIVKLQNSVESIGKFDYSSANTEAKKQALVVMEAAKKAASQVVLNATTGREKERAEKKLADDLMKSALAPFKEAQSELDSLSKSIEKSMDKGSLVTKGLRDQIMGLGYDMKAFDSVSHLTDLNKNFGDLFKHFKATHEILPQLRMLTWAYGGDVDGLAEKLSGLNKSLDFITRLKSQMQSLMPDMDPVKQMLAGNFNLDASAAFMGAGLDLAPFKDLSRLSGIKQDWEKMIASKTMTYTAEMRKYFQDFGGREGNIAVSKMDRGSNTINDKLIADVGASIDAAYLSALKDALAYTEGQQKGVTDSIKSNQMTIAEQFVAVGDQIARELNSANASLIEEIRNLIRILSQKEKDIESGKVSELDRSIKIYGPIYGYDDFEEKVLKAGINLRRRADPQWRN